MVEREIDKELAKGDRGLGYVVGGSKRVNVKAGIGFEGEPEYDLGFKEDTELAF